MHSPACTQGRAEEFLRQRGAVWFRVARAFREPFQLDVQRNSNHHVAFGGPGTHFCLGASFARLELRVMFEELPTRMPELALAKPAAPLELHRGIEEVPVVFAARG